MILKYIHFILLGFAVIAAGCSASSTSGRYQTKNSKDEKTEEVRFTSDENENLLSSVNEDTSAYFNDIEAEQDEDEFPDDEGNVDISEVFKKFNSSSSGEVISADNSTIKEKLLMEIIEYLNTPYKYGGNSKKGIDCSAFTQTVYFNVLSTSLLRSARDQYTQGTVIDNKEDLQFGDLVFFNTRRRVRPGHVGIYIGDNLFAHASSKHGVIISSLDHDYYSKRFMGGRRIDDASFTLTE